MMGMDGRGAGETMLLMLVAAMPPSTAGESTAWRGEAVAETKRDQPNGRSSTSPCGVLQPQMSSAISFAQSGERRMPLRLSRAGLGPTWDCKSSGIETRVGQSVQT